MKNRIALFAVLSAVALSALVPVIAEDKAAAGGEGWVTLFNGKDLEGWTQRNGTATYRIEGDAIVGKTAEGSPNSFLCTDKKYADFELEFEVKVDDALNSGVQIRSQTKDDKPSERVNGPQVEIESSPGQAGYIYGEATSFGWLSENPKSKDKAVNEHAKMKNGEWNQFRVVADGVRIQTWINGEAVEDLSHEKIYETHSEGFIGLQVHGIGKGSGPFEVSWRNIRIKEIKK